MLQVIMENTPAQLVYLDPDFNFVRFNTPYVEGSGHTREALMAHNHFELFPSRENQAIFERVRETGQPVAFHAKPFEYADQPERGTTYWDWTLVPVKDGGGQVQGLVFSLMDVTERKRTEEALREQARALATMEERQRLARDLHDVVSQTLFSASLSAEVLPCLWERDPEEGRRCLEEVHHLTRSALAEMRTLLLELRPGALVETPLSELLNQFVETVGRRARLPVSLQAEQIRPLPADVQVTVYRIAQEALNNVVKHAGASQAVVRLRRVQILHSTGGDEEANGLELCVCDDGCGFNPEEVSPQQLGLGIMRERAEAIGAELTVNTQAGHGTQVGLTWPRAQRKER
jgi:PAS domain S-box-containing protein